MKTQTILLLAGIAAGVMAFSAAAQASAQLPAPRTKGAPPPIYGRPGTQGQGK